MYPVVSTQHTLSLNSPKLLVATNQLSKSNPKVEKMMLEDASVSGLTDEDSVEEVPLKYTCFNCNFVTTSKRKIDDHIADEHAPKLNEDVRFLCTDCEQVFGLEEDYNSHIKTHNVETVNVDIQEDEMKELFNIVMMDIIEHDIDNLKQLENSEQKVLIDCKRCDYYSKDESGK